MLQGIILTQLLTHDQVSLTLGQAALSLSVMALKKTVCFPDATKFSLHIMLFETESNQGSFQAAGIFIPILQRRKLSGAGTQCMSPMYEMFFLFHLE